jgi:rhodanese-related sulfurtransferase
MAAKTNSTNQTGADRAGLDFAIETGLEHGGYVPRGRKAEDGRIDDRYNLVELTTSSYPARTRRNIEESDGTVIFSLARLLSGGTKLTQEYANELETVFDLEELELCYAPQFGGAKDPVNYASMIAGNHLRGDLPLADWQQLAADSALLVDVRDADEFETGHVPGAINLPLNQIRHRLSELPRDREVWLYCGVGQRAYYATRVLMQNGFRVKNLSGGFRTYNLITSSSNGH